MSDRLVRVSVRILEKEYQVACLPEERTDLLDSAEYLNAKMREIRDNGNVIGVDRIAVMAALNLAGAILVYFTIRTTMPTLPAGEVSSTPVAILSNAFLLIGRLSPCF